MKEIYEHHSSLEIFSIELQIRYATQKTSSKPLCKHKEDVKEDLSQLENLKTSLHRERPGVSVGIRTTSGVISTQLHNAGMLETN